MSCITDPLSCPSQIVGGVVGDAAASAWDSVCKSFADATTQLLTGFSKAFVSIPTINLRSGGVSSVYTMCIGLAAVIAAFLLLGQVIRTAWTRDGTPLATGLVGVGKAALTFMLTITIASAGLLAADEITNAIVTQSFGSTEQLSEKMSTIVKWDPTISGSLLLVFALLGILLVAILWFELLLRNAAIAVLVATSPIAAAGEVAGQGWWRKTAAATAQLIILKPVIALVFALGFAMSGQSGDLETLLAGLLILLLAVVAWPAIARFFTFASVQVAGGSGLGSVLGFAAGRMSGGGGTPDGPSPDQFAGGAQARTMANFSGASAAGGGTGGVSAMSPASAAGASGAGGGAAASGAAGGAAAGGAAAVAGPAAVVIAGVQAAQKGVNTVAQKMEGMAGHAGLHPAHPHTEPAGRSESAGSGGGQAFPDRSHADQPVPQAPMPSGAAVVETSGPAPAYGTPLVPPQSREPVPVDPVVPVSPVTEIAPPAHGSEVISNE